MKNTIFLAVLVITQVAGDICLSHGMKQFGEINSWAFSNLVALAGFLLTNFWIIFGVSTLAFSLIIHFILISKLDVSFVLPIHSFSYVLNALMAWLVLKEQVSITRWIATITITMGVFIMIWIEQRYPAALPSKAPNPKKNQAFDERSGLFFLGGSMAAVPKLWLATIVLALADSSGDLLTAMGIKQVGEFTAKSPSSFLAWIRRILINPLMLTGIAGYAAGFAIFLSLLSWADISLVRPATAIGYITSTLGARFILHEHISQGRLIGIVVIGIGVATLSLG